MWLNKTVLLLLTITTGCGSIINGSIQEIRVTSDPMLATVTTDDGIKCLTPCTLELSRKKSHNLEFILDGYEPAKVKVKKSVSGAIWGNLFVGGIIIGSVIDFISGGAYKLKPETVSVQMEIAKKRY